MIKKDKKKKGGKYIEDNRSDQFYSNDWILKITLKNINIKINLIKLNKFIVFCKKCIIKLSAKI